MNVLNVLVPGFVALTWEISSGRIRNGKQKNVETKTRSYISIPPRRNQLCFETSTLIPSELPWDFRSEHSYTDRKTPFSPPCFWNQAPWSVLRNSTHICIEKQSPESTNGAKEVAYLNYGRGQRAKPPKIFIKSASGFFLNQLFISVFLAWNKPSVTLIYGFNKATWHQLCLKTGS